MSAVSRQEQCNITIFVTHLGGTTYEHLDADDQCMKTVIQSYETSDIAEKVQGNNIKGKIICYLRSLNGIDVKWLDSNGKETDYHCDAESVIVGLAAESIIKHLNKSGLIGKDAISFELVKDLGCGICSSEGIFRINLNPDTRKSYKMNAKDGIASHTYANLLQRKLYVFLNDAKPDTLKKVDGVMTAILPKIQKEEEKKD